MDSNSDALLERGTFTLWCPNDIMAKSDASGGFDEERRPIHGICSTERLDRQQEEVIAVGLDFSPFMDYGWFNDNHKQGTADILGWPTHVELRADNKWYTKGHLLTGTTEADRVWALAKALVKSKAPRGLGFSIEGKVLQRNDRNRIVRAIVRNVAITNCPVNPDCSWSILAKSFAPLDEIKKAMTAGYGFPPTTGPEVMRSEELEDRRQKLLEITKRVMNARPTWPTHLAVRFARYLVNKKSLEG